MVQPRVVYRSRCKEEEEEEKEEQQEGGRWRAFALARKSLKMKSTRKKKLIALSTRSICSTSSAGTLNPELLESFGSSGSMYVAAM